jgi:hypothetical protein
MRVTPLLLALLLSVGLLGLLPVAADTPKKAEAEADDTNRIAKLVEQLGSESFAERKKATEALDEIGGPALDALRKATQSNDLETRKRATDLVRRIEKRVASARILQATQVHLVFKDTPLDRAVVEISKKTGYLVRLHDPDGKLKDKKITLDTGKTTFWNALNQFCEKARLVDGTPNGGNVMPGQALLPPGNVQVMPVLPGGNIVPPVKVRVMPLLPARNIVPPVKVPPPPPAPNIVPPANPAPAAPATKPAEKKEGEEKKAPDKKAPDKKAPDKKEAERKEAAKAQVKGGLAVAVVQVQAQAPPAGGVPVVGKVQLGPPAAAPLQPRRWGPAQQGDIHLMPGKPAQKAADTTSSIRVRPADSKHLGGLPPDKDHLVVVLEVAPEPKVRWQRLVSMKIDRAVDDNKQKLTGVDDPAPGAGPGALGGGGLGRVMVLPARAWMPLGAWNAAGLYHHVPVKLKKGARETKSLTELSGTISAQVLDRAEPMLVVDNLMKAAGKSVKGTRDGELKIHKVDKTNDGTVTIEFEMEMPADVVPETQPDGPPAAANQQPGAAVGLRARIMLGGRGALAVSHPNSGLTLQDDKGKPLSASIMLNWKQGGFAPGGAQARQSYIATYRAGQGMPAEPSKLVFTGRRTVDVNIPFTLRNVSLDK